MLAENRQVNDFVPVNFGDDEKVFSMVTYNLEDQDIMSTLCSLIESAC